MGRVTHEMRNMLNTALLAFDAVKRGTVGVNGNTGAVLGRSLTGLRDLVDSTISDIRTAASHQRPELISISGFLNDIGAAAELQAEYDGVHFTIEPIDDDLAVMMDRQLLASAVTNLLSNAFKYTPAGGRVILRARATTELVAIEVEDACGGIPESSGDLFTPFGERRARRSPGLGLGLSIARKAVRAQGGDIDLSEPAGQGLHVRHRGASGGRRGAAAGQRRCGLERVSIVRRAALSGLPAREPDFKRGRRANRRSRDREACRFEAVMVRL